MFSIWFNMYRFLLFALIAAVGAKEMDEATQKCRRAFYPDLMTCCITVPNDSMFYAKAKECDSIPRDPVNCEHVMCVAKKTGFLTDEGDIDKDKVKKVIEESFAGQTDLLDAIKNKCFEGDLEMYGAPNFCHLLKFKMCINTQVFTMCREWNNAGDCKGVKELAEECAKALS